MSTGGQIVERLTRALAGFEGARVVSAYLFGPTARATSTSGSCLTAGRCRAPGTGSKRRFSCRRTSSRPWARGRSISSS